jgi:DNA-dependent RNA polymerase auxiliary subunit epsilon
VVKTLKPKTAYDSDESKTSAKAAEEARRKLEEKKIEVMRKINKQLVEYLKAKIKIMISLYLILN